MNVIMNFKEIDDSLKVNFGEATRMADSESYSSGYRAGQDAGHAEGFEEGQVAGYESGLTEIENRITYNGERQHYSYAFSNQDWSGYTFKTPVVPKTGISNVFWTYYGTALPGNIDFSQATTSPPDLMFRYANNITHIHDINLQAPTQYKQTFADMKAIKKIDIVRCNESTQFNQAFQNLSTLEEVTFDGVIGQNGLNLQWSTNLTRESLLSILNCLQDKSSDTSATWQVTIGSANLAKLTTEEVETAKAKGWWIA